MRWTTGILCTWWLQAIWWTTIICSGCWLRSLSLASLCSQLRTASLETTNSRQRVKQSEHSVLSLSLLHWTLQQQQKPVVADCLINNNNNTAGAVWAAAPAQTKEMHSYVVCCRQFRFVSTVSSSTSTTTITSIRADSRSQMLFAFCLCCCCCCSSPHQK